MRIDVADPGSERLAIVGALVAAGFEVSTRAPGEIHETTADLLVLAGDAPHALAALRRLRDDGRRPDVPVILVGTPEGLAPIMEGPGLGAELVLGRPFDETRLVAGAHRLLRTREKERSIVARLPEHTLELRERRPESGDDDDPSGVSAIRNMNGRESEVPPPPRSDHGTGRGTGVSQIERRSEVPSGTNAGTPAPGSGPGVSSTGISSAGISSAGSSSGHSNAGFHTTGTGPGTSDVHVPAPISDSLRVILLAADRRVFPGLAAIDISIPAGEASARELVPDELFDDAAADAEGEEEALFVAPAGAAALATGSTFPRRAPSESPSSAPPKTAPGTPHSLSQLPRAASTAAGPRPSARPAEGLATVSEDEALGPLGEGGIRTLALAPGATLRALASLVLTRATTVAAIAAPDLEVELVLSRGELVHVRGPVHRRALAFFGRSAADDATAEERLRALVDRGDVGAAERELALRRAERELLSAVLLLTNGRAEFRPAAEEDAPARLGPTGRLLGELASRLRATAIIDAVLGAAARLAPTRALSGVIGALGLSPELGAFFAASDEGPTRIELARGARLAPELPAVAALLVASGALRPEGRATGSVEADRAQVESLVRKHAALADDADYFSLLGLDPTATAEAVRHAHAARTAMLGALPLDDLGLGALEPLARRALDAADEALEALSDDALRAAYALALTRGAAPTALPGASSPSAV